jgi:hypothetical protein
VIKPDSTQEQNNPMMYDCAGRSFIMLLNTRNPRDYGRKLNAHEPWSDTQPQKPGPISTPTAHAAAAQTGTRIQTHQNLFTLTKNNSFLNIEAGSKHPVIRFDLTFSGTGKAENRNSIFPINDLARF